MFLQFLHLGLFVTLLCGVFCPSNSLAKRDDVGVLPYPVFYCLEGASVIGLCFYCFSGLGMSSVSTSRTQSCFCNNPLRVLCHEGLLCCVQRVLFDQVWEPALFGTAHTLPQGTRIRLVLVPPTQCAAVVWLWSRGSSSFPPDKCVAPLIRRYPRRVFAFGMDG